MCKDLVVIGIYKEGTCILHLYTGVYDDHYLIEGNVRTDDFDIIGAVVQNTGSTDNSIAGFICVCSTVCHSDPAKTLLKPGGSGNISGCHARLGGFVELSVTGSDIEALRSVLVIAIVSIQNRNKFRLCRILTFYGMFNGCEILEVLAQPCVDVVRLV